MRINPLSSQLNTCVDQCMRPFSSMVCCSRSKYLWTTLGLFAATRAYDSASECLNVSSEGLLLKVSHHPLLTSISAPCEFMICCTIARTSLHDLVWPIEAQPQTKSATLTLLLVTEKPTVRHGFRIDAVLFRSLVLECGSWHPILLTGVADAYLRLLNCFSSTDHLPTVAAVCGWAITG